MRFKNIFIDISKNHISLSTDKYQNQFTWNLSNKIYKSMNYTHTYEIKNVYLLWQWLKKKKKTNLSSFV